MKSAVFISLICAFGFSACTLTPLTRQDLLHHLGRMRDMDAKFEEIQTYASLAALLGIDVSESQAKKLEEHSELYWLHYYAANVAIASGDIPGYESHLQMSQVEMEAIEVIIDQVISRIQPEQLQIEPFPRQNL